MSITVESSFPPLIVHYSTIKQSPAAPSDTTITSRKNDHTQSARHDSSLSPFSLLFPEATTLIEERSKISSSAHKTTLFDLNTIYFLVCDYFKRIPQVGHLLNNLPLLLFPGICYNTNRLQYRRLKRRQQRRQRSIRISGLPNQGQTCFLNSVLQCLASLQHFLAYLEEIVHIQEERSIALVPLSSTFEQIHISQQRARRKITLSSSSSPSFSRQLLCLLDGINYLDGDTYDDFLDDSEYRRRSRGILSSFLQQRTIRRRKITGPNSLLRQIAKHNRQFQPYRMEQQDAQELLATLIEVVIQDVGYNNFSYSNSSNSEIGVNSNNENEVGTRCSVRNDDDDDELMTSVFANKRSNNKECTSKITSIDGTELILADEDELNTVSFSSLLLRIGKYQEHCMSQEYRENNQYNQCSHRFPEEKTQEHKDYHSLTNNGLSTVLNSRRRLSTAKKRMRGTMSSISPSPMSGWLGSTLRCSKCQHVRPIQNAPFLDIPLVPTSVQSYLSRAYSFGVKPVPPNSSSILSCTLNDCFENFTAMEVVSDVMCQFCTIQKEIGNLEEEAMMLRGAIETTEMRMRRRKRCNVIDDGNVNINCTKQAKCLRDDLLMTEKRLLRLRMIDPDDDNIEHSLCSIVKNTDNNFLLTSDQEKIITMQRGEATKCLLITRTPSILCCHIQRRYYDPFTNRMEKCIQMVEFPLLFDLSLYCAYGSGTITPWAVGSGMNKDGRKKKDPIPYRLQSVIEHQGNAHGGHYVAYRRDHYSGIWFRISDRIVTKVSWRNVQACQAYMLFYESM